MLFSRAAGRSNALRDSWPVQPRFHKPCSLTGHQQRTLLCSSSVRVNVAAVEQRTRSPTVFVNAAELQRLILTIRVLRKENEALRQAVAFYGELQDAGAGKDVEADVDSRDKLVLEDIVQDETTESTGWEQEDDYTQPQYNDEYEIDDETEHMEWGAPAQFEPVGPPPPARLLDIVFVAAEAAPYSKTGGLGDVMGSLPIALAERGHRVMVVVPRYLDGKNEEIYESMTQLPNRCTIDLWGGGQHHVGFFHQHKDNVDWVFVDHVSYHRPGCTPYGSPSGPFADNLFRFSLLSMAALEAPLLLHIGGFRHSLEPGSPYGQDVLFVANDWHAAMVPVYLKARYQPHNVYKNARCVMAIHNLAFQGPQPPSAFQSLGLSGSWRDTLHWLAPTDPKLQSLNILKAGLVTADRLVTVSQGYALEIMGPKEGLGLELLLNQRVDALRGIVNGINTAEWDPSRDQHLEQTYDIHDLSGKQACKVALQEEMGLPYRPRVPIVGFVGRLDYQKGPDLVLEAMGHLANMDVQVVMLGSGAPDYEAAVKATMEEYPRCFAGHVGFSVPLAHRILAGCDILLMPSRFEPCGLNQLYAMRYGTIPIAHSTGGLRDTIEDYNSFSTEIDDMGTGWTFSPATQEAMLDTLRSALLVLRKEPDRWASIQINGMTRDFSWTSSAYQYETMLTETIEDKKPGSSNNAKSSRT